MNTQLLHFKDIWIFVCGQVEWNEYIQDLNLGNCLDMNKLIFPFRGNLFTHF